MGKVRNRELWRIWRKYPGYRWLTLSMIMTGLANWGAFIAMLVLVSQITENGLQLGALWAISGLAPVLFSFVLGAWADRFNSKKVILFAEGTNALLFLGFVFVPMLEGAWSWAVFLAIRLMSGLAGSIATIARQTMIPDIIDKDDLVVANTFNFTIYSSIRLFGAAGGGVLISFVDLNVFWLVASLAFLASFVVISWISYRNPKPVKTDKNIVKEILTGLTVMKEERFVRMVLIAALTGGLIIGSFNLMIEQLVSTVYETKEYGISLLYISEGIVSVIIGYWIANNKILFKKTHRYGLIYILMGVSWAVFGFTTELFQGMLVLMVFAFVGGFIVPFERQVMQTNVPPELRGRVFGLWNTCSMLSLQAGAFVTGLIIYYVGLQYVTLLIALAEIALGVYFYLNVKRWSMVEKEEKVLAKVSNR